MPCPISKEERANLTALGGNQDWERIAKEHQPLSDHNGGDQRELAAAQAGGNDVLPELDPTGQAPLSAPERVIVKDIWNKFLAYQDMLLEMFFERLLYEEPELIELFGDSLDSIPRYFAQLFDRSVRQLDPRTEQVLRESYRGIYPEHPGDPQSVEECATLLADVGMRPEHWLVARRAWVWMISEVPHLEEYDQENLAKGTESAPYRFFTYCILPPVLAAIERYDTSLTPDMIRQMRVQSDQLAAQLLAAGTEFYRILFQTHPEMVSYFGRTDIDTLANHLMQTIVFLIRALEMNQNVGREIRELARVHTNLRIPPDAYANVGGPLITVLRQFVPDFGPDHELAWSLVLNRVCNVMVVPMHNQQRVLAQAKTFLQQVATELEWAPGELEQRLREVEREISATGTYTHTSTELSYGAQLAWRNSTKCIGRIAWRNMVVRDMRHVTDPDAIFKECVEHLRVATNGGNIQIVMTVFRPKKPLERWGPRIWNSQLIRFAGYPQDDGTILGDPANLKLTRALQRLGWTPPAERTAFDCLPLAVEVPGLPPKLYEFDSADVLTVPIEHPAYPGFQDLSMRWCAVPAIANFRLEIGGVNYGCLPFNGWFMETEIARNLWEENRYNKAEAIARVMELDTSSEQTLWRDRTFLELNAAVLYSFSKTKVTLVDHQTASRQFLMHDQREKRAGRECPAQWSWVVPSAGGSTTPVWHHEMRDFHLSPNYHYAADKWAVVDADLTVAGEKAEQKSTVVNRVLILYGSETGTAEAYARQVARRLGHLHHPQVMALNEYDVSQLGQEQWLLIVTSTFGNGELPGNAQQFFDWLRQQPANTFTRLNYSVMALGSTVYPHFCAAGTAFDRELARVGAYRAVVMHEGDEIRGQADTFRQWLSLIARVLGDESADADTLDTDKQQLRVEFLPPRQQPARDNDTYRQRLPGVTVPVIDNRELLKEVIVGSRSTRFVAFDISGTELAYETGDHVAVYPNNPASWVQRLCQRLQLDSDVWFTARLVDETGQTVDEESPYVQPANVRQVLTEDVDLLLREPFDELISVLLEAASIPSQQTQLQHWIDVLAQGDKQEECRQLKKYLADQYPTVVDLLEAFPEVPVTFAKLIDLLPKQKPRLYSISSCSLVHPRQIHITVGVVQIVTDAGQSRPGVCSHYLSELDPARPDTVRITVRTSHFRPPKDPQVPMLMVGPGTGLSPLVGFLQHREVQLRALRHEQGLPVANGQPSPARRKMGQTRLFFGCRNLNDYLYQQELETWHEAGVLTHLDVAFSRLGDDKIYVQHLISRHSQDLWEVLSQPDCHYYVCGDAKMADEVFAELMKIARTAGGLSHAEAVGFFQKMQRENRFVMDVWGILHNFQTAIAEVQDARYTQGARWLEQLNQFGNL